MVKRIVERKREYNGREGVVGTRGPNSKGPAHEDAATSHGWRGPPHSSAITFQPTSQRRDPLSLSLSLSNPNNPLLRINLSNYCPYASGQNLVVLLICGRTIPQQQAIGQGPFAYGQNLPQQQAIGQFSQRTPLLPLPKVRYSNDKKQKKQLVAGNDWESHGLGGIELCINWEKCDSHNDSIIELTTPFSSFYP